jgi:hypothetical protein
MTIADRVLSQTEQNVILAICALNKLENKKEFYKKITFGKLNISLRWRSSKCFWGRFGGGWQWALGFEMGSRTINLNCLIFNILIWREK